MPQVIIVGAGLAGLTAAHYLQEAGLEVAVLEKSFRPGGRVQSDLVDGYILDHGFQVINSGYSEIKRLDLLAGLDFQNISPNIRLSAADNRIIGISQLGASIGSISGSVREKFSFAAFLTGKVERSTSFGQAAERFPALYRNILAPFLTGVFLSDPAEVSAQVAREIIRSFLTGRPGVPARGVGALSEKLAGPIRTIAYGAEVISLEAGRVSGNFGTLAADNIILATSSSLAEKLLMRKLQMPNLSSTTWYHSTSEKLSHSRSLVVTNGKGVVNSVVISDVAESYAPAGRHLISTTALATLAESDLHRQLDALWSTNTRSWELVGRYEIGESLNLHRAGFTALSGKQFSPGLYLAGDFTDLPSQQGAMRSGRLAAEEIIRSQR
jgi:phytoene dehydrogenase-like protein